MWRDRLWAVCWLAFPLLIVVATPRTAHAQPSSDRMATATSLFETGQALVQEGKVADACAKFEESYRLVSANGTLINLADCYERMGRTASAWLKFREVATKSERDGQSARAIVARERIVALEPRLSRLRVVLGDNAALQGLEVSRDDVQLGRAAVGLAVPVDPGEHRVVVSAPGYERRTIVTTVERQGVTVDALVPPLVPLVAPNETTPPPQTDWQTPVGIASLALGGAGVVVGVALGIGAKVKAGKADCDADDTCSPAGLTQRGDAVSLGNIGTVVGIIGAVIGAVGLTVWLTAPAAEEQLALRVVPGGARFVVSY